MKKLEGWSRALALSLGLLSSCGRTQLNEGAVESRASCEPPTVDCGSGPCIDILHDPSNCGGCGQACGAGELCDRALCVKPCVGDNCACMGASCEVACQDGQLTCRSGVGERVCVDPRNDPNHCGACDNACPAGSRCEGSQCCADELCCPEPLSSCNEPDGALACVDTSRSNRHCGGCDAACNEGTTCVAGVCKACSTLQFFLPVAEEVGPLAESTPVRPLVSDVDGDGHLDVVTASSGGSSLTLTRGDGRGGFAAPERIETLVAPRAVASGDFDADGDVDLATVGQSGIMLHDARGDGSWGRTLLPHEGARDSTMFIGLVSAQLSGDARPELVLLTQTTSGGEVFVLENGSQGWHPTLVRSTAQVLTRLQAGDFDGDGFTDIAAWGKTGDVLWGDGVGFRLDESRLDPKNRAETPLALADLDGDGLADMVTAEAYGQGTLFYGYYFRTHLADAAGGFQELPRGDAITGSHPPLIDLADVDANGVLDLLSPEEDVSLLATFTGVGDGSFISAASSAVAPDTNGFSTGDFDEDGLLDVVALHLNAGAFTLHVGEDNGGFESPLLTLPEQTYLRDARIHHYADRDVPSIVVVGGLDEGRLRVLELDGSLEARQIQEVPIYRPLSLVLGDVDGDGEPDAIVPAERGLYWLRYVGGGQFSTPESLGNLRGVQQAVSGDVAGDGRPKVFTATWDGIDGSIIHVISSTGVGFQDTPFDAGAAARVAIGNVGFGRLNLVVAGGGRLQVLDVSSSGAVTEVASTDVAAQYPVLELADLDGDGDQEVVVGGSDGYGSGYVAYDASVGAGLTQLAAATEPILSRYFGATFAYSHVTNLDDDGLADFLESGGDGLAVLWRGHGDGTFERDETYRLPGGRELVGLDDFDRDGIEDMLLKGSSPYAGSLLLVRGATQCQ